MVARRVSPARLRQSRWRFRTCPSLSTSWFIQMTRCSSQPSRRPSTKVDLDLTVAQDGRSGKAASLRWTHRCGRYLGLVLTGLALFCAACGQSPAVLMAFRTEDQAQTHCPKDTVVWIDPQSAMYYLKGHGSYGRSTAGRYACRGEADQAGMHGVPN